jgi:hypothetical protein
MLSLCKVINIMTGLGMPVSRRVARLLREWAKSDHSLFCEPSPPDAVRRGPMQNPAGPFQTCRMIFIPG